MSSIGLVDPADVIDGVKVRVPKAYPMYVGGYREDVAELRGYLAAFDNLKTFGRNGLHRYNNQDHSDVDGDPGHAQSRGRDGVRRLVGEHRGRVPRGRRGRRLPSSMSTSSADDRPISVVVADNEAQLLVPEQWRDGIDGADGEIVCLTISVMRPGPGWLDTAWRLSREADAVGGAIEPGDDLRLRDWAEYFCRYARDMLPFPTARRSTSPGTTRSTGARRSGPRTTSFATASGSSR